MNYHFRWRSVSRQLRRLLPLILTVFASLLYIANTYAQTPYSETARISINKKDATISEIIAFIESESEFSFLYSPAEIDVNKRISISGEKMLISNILNTILKDSNIKYKIDNRHIVLFKTDPITPPTPNTNTTARQEITIKGTVTDNNNEAIPMVSVSLKGTTIKTYASIDGTYEITIPSNTNNAVLVFSFVGFADVEEVVGSRSEINTTLKSEVNKLDEVVVVGYGVQKKVNMTGSITSLKTKDIESIPVSNLSNAMAGRAPGVNVVGNSGLAGASSSIRIRGSFVEPLYVINGIIRQQSDFDALDVNEVESINFLKDAATASIYGSRASNGVVLVTTKVGKMQKPSFSYTGSYSVSNTTKSIPNYSATEELEYVNQMNITKGNAPKYGPEIFDYFKDKSYNINDYIWQNPTTNQHNISVSGGNETMTYFLMGGMINQNGSYKSLGYNKYNFRSDVTAKISKRFKVNVNVSGNQREFKRWYWPYDAVDNFNVGDFYRATFNWSKLYPFYVDAEGNPANQRTEYPVVPAAWHPVELMSGDGYNKNTYRTFDGIIKFDLDLSDVIDGLRTSFLAEYTGMDKFGKAFVKHNKSYLFQSAGGSNPFIPGRVDPSQLIIHNLSSTYENIAENVDFNNSYQINWFLTYDKVFKEKHAVSALAVYEQTGSKSKNLNGRADKLLSPVIDQIFNTSSDATHRWFDGKETEEAMSSFIGRFNYSFASKYIAEFSFRYDGNYKFGPGERWGFFPSFSSAWRISEEGFMKEIDWLSNLKIKASYGTAGSDVRITGTGRKRSVERIGSFQWSQRYVKASDPKGFVFGDGFYDGLRPSVVPNRSVSWATSHMYNAGIEFGILKNKLTGELDFYRRVEQDILGNRMSSTPSTLGADLPAENYAKRTYKGLELGLNWNDNIGGEFFYSVSANLGYSIDKWNILDQETAYIDGTYANNWRSKIGQAENRLYGLISEGMLRSQEDVDRLDPSFTQFGRKPLPGTLLFKDIRGANFSEGRDGKIDENDMTYLSNNGAPRINYGFGVKLEWKGISLNAFFQGVAKYKRMVSTRNTEDGGVFQVDRPYFEIWARNYWTPENPGAKYPRVAGDWTAEEYGGGASTFWMRNGAYLRLKNLELAYSLPQKWYSILGLQRVQVFGNITNLFTITGFKEHDPEQQTLDSYPLMRTFTGGLNINF